MVANSEYFELVAISVMVDADLWEVGTAANSVCCLRMCYAMRATTVMAFVTELQLHA